MNLRVTLASFFILALAACVFVGLLLTSAGAQTARTDAAREAAEAYARADWDAAIALYEGIPGADAEVLYNLGTTYAQKGERGQAVLMLLRALRLSPRDEDIRGNLAIVAPEIYSQTAIFPLPPLQAIYGRLGLNEWAVLAGILTVLLGVLLGLKYWSPRGGRMRPMAHRLALSAFFLASIAHAFAWVKYYEEAYSPRGIVTAPDAFPSTAPSETADTYTFVLPPGTFVRIETSGVRGWVKVIYGGRNEVFLPRNQVEYLSHKG